MKLFAIAALAAAVGVGLLLMVAGVRGIPVLGRHVDSRPRWAAPRRELRRWGTAVIAAVVAFALTGWPVLALLAALAAWLVPGLLGGKAAREGAISRTEAIASWTEMVRDQIAAASGLEEAIVDCASYAPEAIAPEIQALVRRLEHERLPEALVGLGRDLQHPCGDAVVAALVLACRLEVADLASSLSRLAGSVRDEARMRIRVEVSRSRVRTSGRVIAGAVVSAFLLLAIANRDYLSPYDSAGGQVVLGVVGGIFAFGGWLLARMATIEMPERFTTRTLNAEVSP